jgi:perosamine synthetase
MKNPIKYLGNELLYLEKVLNSESWSSTSGTWVKTLEEAFAKKHGMKYAIAANSGTSTLHAALEAMDIRPGDEVIVPPLTVVMSTTSVIHANAIPVYADVDRDTFNIDPVDVEKKITPRTKAIQAVAIYGLPPNLPKLREIANKYKIGLIEDNAECVLSKVACENVCEECKNGCIREEKLSGTFGDFSSYSFENTKHISCGEGGMLLTNNSEYAERARKLCGHGFKNLGPSEGRVRLKAEVFQNPNYLRHDELGWNYRMPEFNAAIALAQFERVEELINLRVKSAEIFIDSMKDYDFFKPQLTPPGYTNSYYTLGVVYEGQEETGVSWNEVRKKYVENGGDGIYSCWATTYKEPVIRDGKYKYRYPEIYQNLQLEKSNCPNAEYLQKRIMQFKTNYRDLDLAKKKADIFRKTLKQLF